MNRPVNSLGTLNSAKKAAQMQRAEWLMLVLDEMVTPDDVIREAASPESKPLLKISLRQLLMARPGWGRKRASQVITDLLAVSGVPADTPQPTIGWLLDPRAAGRRHEAWIDVTGTGETVQWPGFPYTRSRFV